MIDQQSVFSCEDKIFTEVVAVNEKLDKLVYLLSTLVPEDALYLMATTADEKPQQDANQIKLTVKAFSAYLHEKGYKNASYLTIQNKLMENGIITRRSGTKRTGEPQTGYELTAKGHALDWIEAGGCGSILLYVPQAESEIVKMIGCEE